MSQPTPNTHDFRFYDEWESELTRLPNTYLNKTVPKLNKPTPQPKQPDCYLNRRGDVVDETFRLSQFI